MVAFPMLVIAILLLFIVNHINCELNISNETNPFLITSTVNVANTTLTYATSVSSDNCNYHRSGVYMTLRANKILQAMTIQNYTINIEFDIKLNHHCNNSLCNIVYISSNTDVGTISLSLNKTQNYFEISVITDINFTETHRIPNADTLLPFDGKYHHLHLIHTFVLSTDINIQNQNIFKIDNSTYTYYSAHTSSIPPNQTYDLYISSKYNHAINASISNICFKSSVELDRQIRCGDIIQSELISSSDIQFFYFNASTDLEYLLFDSCGSLFNTYLGLVTNQFQIINEGDDDGDCDNREQLLIQQLAAGQYILIVLGYGELRNHEYGKWRIEVMCKKDTSTTPNPSTNINITNDTASTTCANYKTIKCGDILHGKLEHFRNGTILAYYDKLCFTLTNYAYMVYFDSCGSNDPTTLNLYHENVFNFIDDVVEGYCWKSAGLKMSHLEPGQYILEIASEVTESSHNYQIHVSCSGDIIDPEQYKFIPYYYKQWFNAQLECEKQYGTALATIQTNEDMMKAVNILQNSFWDYGAYTASWIGLYADIDLFNNAVWHWVEGATCNSTSPKECSSYLAWSNPDTLLVPIGTYLGIYWWYDTAWNSTYTAAIYNYKSSYYLGGMPLCNAPEAGDKPWSCSKSLKCWRNFNLLETNDFFVTIDAAFDVDAFRPPLAYWNSQLFVIGLHFIHNTNISLYDNLITWNHIKYHNNSLDTSMISQRYAQYQSSLFLYVYRNFTDDILVHINLDTLGVQSHFVPTKFQPYYVENSNVKRDSYCVVAGGDYVYIVRAASILIYEIFSDTWHAVDFVDVIAGACVITNDNKYIYIFGNNDEDISPNIYNMDEYEHIFFIIKYDVKIKDFQYVSTPNLCRPFSKTRVIAGGNGKLYLHGCYPASWKTLVFDTTSDQFEKQTIDIDIPTNKHMAYYRTAQLTVFDDNILFLMHTTDSKYPRISIDYISIFNDISLYYTVTESISINFTQTTLSLQQHIWPSDGFIIKYYLNDFENSTNNVYSITFQSNNTINNIHALITLNTSNDDCICRGYNCRDCQHQFHLSDYLSPTDNNVTKLNFIPIHNYHFNVLLRPTTVTMMLQRCHLTINVEKPATNNIDPSIVFDYFLSNNCYSRNGYNFSANIMSDSVNISKELIIGIMDNNNVECKLCDIQTNDCIKCSNDSFIIHHETKGLKNGDFSMFIESNMIDLNVISTVSTIAYAISHRDSYLNQDLLYLLFLSVICIPLIIIVMYYRREYKKAFEVHKALVLLIGCAKFKEKKYDLKGVSKNIEDLRNLWGDGYKYDVFVVNPETLYSTKQDIIRFIDEHKGQLEGNNYQSVIVHIISHGVDDGDSFWSSDQQIIKIEDIQRELTEAAKYDIKSPLIKIIFNHGCRGNEIYNIGSRGIFSNHGSTEHKTAEEETVTEEKQSMDVVHDVNKWEDSNWVIIWGNIKDRAMSDCGDFTECICNAFENNLKKLKKKNFRTLITEIGVELEVITNGAEICNINDTLRIKQIRLEKNNEAAVQYPDNAEIEMNNINIQCDNSNLPQNYTELQQIDTNDSINNEVNAKGDANADETVIEEDEICLMIEKKIQKESEMETGNTVLDKTVNMKEELNNAAMEP